MNKVNIAKIARVCYAVNRAICKTFGDRSQMPWGMAEQWQRDSVVRGVEYALNNPGATPADLHGAWMADKLADGWTYGVVRNPALKKHPCLVPYDQLPAEQQVKDATFREIVYSLSLALPD